MSRRMSAFGGGLKRSTQHFISDARDGVDGRWVEDMFRGFNAVAKEELWNRWRYAFAVQPSGSATQ
jgi:hypothetical protein